MLLHTQGRISEIIPTGEYFGNLLMKKRVKGMIQPIVFEIKGGHFRACTSGKEFREGDKVRIWFVPICRKYNNRYYTNLSVEKIELIERPAKNLFWNDDDDDDEIVDTDTGEVLNYKKK